MPNERLCFEAFVILGLDPRIHKEISTVPVERWIAGSSPAMTIKKNPGMTCTAGARQIVRSLLQRPRCYGWK
ncbi:MAG: hypothetical protein J6L86_08005 [Alphaproteobacteria bacterium]|nr:hypothetical protein [Alphaproteobacteria bacterium]